jgi:Major Facilitator Superfamily
VTKVLCIVSRSRLFYFASVHHTPICTVPVVVSLVHEFNGKLCDCDVSILSAYRSTRFSSVWPNLQDVCDFQANKYKSEKRGNRKCDNGSVDTCYPYTYTFTFVKQQYKSIMYHYHRRLLFMVMRLLVLHGSGFLVHKITDCAAFVRTTTFPHATRIINTGRTFPLYQTKGASSTTQQQQQQQEEQEIFTSASFPTTTTTATSEATIVTVTPSVDYQDNIMDDVSLLLPSTSTSDPAIRSNSRWNIDDRPGTSQEGENDRRTVLVLLWFIAAISAMDRVAMSVALVPMSYEYSSIITDTTKGMISSLFSIGYGLAILPAGLLISCTPPKTLMTFGIFIWSIATIATPISAEWIVLTTVPILCIRSIVGMGEAVLIPTVHRLLSVWTTSEQKSSGTFFYTKIFVFHQ